MVCNMGNCCTKDGMCRGVYMEHGDKDEQYHDHDYEDIQYGDCGARIRLQGSSGFISMFTQEGKKGINQDAMTVWEEFTSEEGMVFCGVFDGHGPYGHIISRNVRNALPSKLSNTIRTSQPNICEVGDITCEDIENNSNKFNQYLCIWESNFVESFKQMDEQLSSETNADTYCSGTTAVTLVKQGDNLLMANLGDSRAIICTRGNKNQLVPVQLTCEMKPDIPCEAERIRSCNGRVFADEEEPDVYRVWMPNEDCPGLAMARAFGDFCLKQYGLISTPEVYYRRLTKNDEFVVLASDGIWDVLSNSEVINIVASAEKQTMAAKLLVKRAVKTWKYKYPTSKVDDCAAIILFLKDQQASLTEPKPTPRPNMSRDRKVKNDIPKLTVSDSLRVTASDSFRSARSEGEIEFVDGKFVRDQECEEEKRDGLGGLIRANSIRKIPRLNRGYHSADNVGDFLKASNIQVDHI